MNDQRDEVMVAVMNADWERAKVLIERIQSSSLVDTEFDLTPCETNEFEKATDFLPFHGWESA